METLTGRTLDHLISESSRPLSAAELANLATHLASALRYLHGEGILHLDLKPSNVIAEQGCAKVIDLSHARPPVACVRATGRGVTWRRSRRAGGGEVTAAADAWGLGIVLHEAMVGSCALARIADELDVDEPSCTPACRRCGASVRASRRR